MAAAVVIDVSLLVEPDSVFVERHTHAQEDTFAFVAADPLIFSQLKGGPLRLTTVLNITARMMPARNKRQKLAIKHEILMRLTALIRRCRLKRIKRIFVALPTHAVQNAKPSA